MGAYIYTGGEGLEVRDGVGDRKGWGGGGD